MQESKIRAPVTRPASSTTSGYISPSQGNRQEPTLRRKTLQENSEPQKERETKDDGRYIIYYTFEDEED